MNIVKIKFIVVVQYVLRKQEIKEREEIFTVHLRGLKLAEDFDLEFLAKHTPGFSGADIANVCNEAALTAARHDKEAVDKQDFLDAVNQAILPIKDECDCYCCRNFTKAYLRHLVNGSCFC